MARLIIVMLALVPYVGAQTAVEVLRSVAPQKQHVDVVENLVENARTGSYKKKEQKFGFRTDGTPGEYMLVAQAIAFAALNSITSPGITEPNYLEGSDKITGKEGKIAKTHRQASQQIHMLIKRLAQHFAKNPNDVFEAMYNPAKFYKKSYDAFTGVKILDLEYISQILGRTFVLDALNPIWEYLKKENKQLQFVNIERKGNKNLSFNTSQPTYFAATNFNYTKNDLARAVSGPSIQSLRLTNSYISGATITDHMQAFSFIGSSTSLAKIVKTIKSHKKLKALSIEIGDDNLKVAPRYINLLLAANRPLKYLQLGAYDTGKEFRQLFNAIDLKHNKELVGLDITNVLVNYNPNFMVKIPQKNNLKFIRFLGIDERYLPTIQTKIKQGAFQQLEEMALQISNMTNQGGLQTFLENLDLKKLPNLKKLIVKTMPSYKYRDDKMSDYMSSKGIVFMVGELDVLK